MEDRGYFQSKNKNKELILFFNQINSNDVPIVGGKNASLGEMYNELTKKDVQIPNGFATTVAAWNHFLEFNKIRPKLEEIFKTINIEDVKEIQEKGEKARNLILQHDFPLDLKNEIIKAYEKLSKYYNKENLSVAVRSSATAEDLAIASFAGQHETYLNIKGSGYLLEAIKKCMASLFTNRAIVYRIEKGFDWRHIALSVTVQKMVRSDLASSGVMFTLDTESGFKDLILITSGYGLGELIVQGKIIPDEFYVFKPTFEKQFKPIIVKNLGSKKTKMIYQEKGIKEIETPLKDQLKFSLTDEEILTLAKWAIIIENHYSQKKAKWTPQDIEWAKDGEINQLFIVQSRPETIYVEKSSDFYEEYRLEVADQKPILQGIAIGEKITSGKVNIIKDISDISKFKKGEILVTQMTDPDWVAIMKIAKAIITDQGGRTCHSAIVSRELGIPCIVGTHKATEILKTGQKVTVDCSQGAIGNIFQDEINFKVMRYNLENVKPIIGQTKIMINIGIPELAPRVSFLPNEGVGLARIEFLIAKKIQIHPLALYHYDKINDSELKNKINEITIEHPNKRDYFVKELAEGIAQIAASFYPKPVIVRLSDFRSNEYAELIGGKLFEPANENNPMIGWRGASRYYSEKFQPAFEMECQALLEVINVFGLKNIKAMVPFCRTVEEGKKTIALMEQFGLKRGKDGIEIYVMCEIPSNVILASEFLEIFDGMSIGSNDLTQLTLGLDRDNAAIANISDERDQAVKGLIIQAIKACKSKNKYIGFCGDAPSSFIDFAQFLIDAKIDSISLTPDVVVKTIANLVKPKKI